MRQDTKNSAVQGSPTENKSSMKLHQIRINGGDIYTTKGTSSPILRRSEEDRVKLCDMNR